MKAIVQHAYGSPDVLEFTDVDKPTVDDDSVLVRVRAAAVNALDWHFLRGEPYVMRLSEGLRKPKASAPGVDVAGQVEAVGKNVTQFRPGDEVFGMRSGAFAEYVRGKEHNFALKPANLTFEQAAAVPVAATTALQGLRDKGQLQPGQKVLINGAGGGVGTFAVQIAKVLGGEVTGVCGPANVDIVRSIGADRVLDYTQEDFTRSGARYDLMLDIAANRSLSDCRRVLAPNATLVLVGARPFRWFRPLVRMLGGVVLSRFVSQRIIPFLSQPRQEDLIALRGHIEAEKVMPVIDRTYPLSETPEAIRYVELGHARGKVVITV